MPRRDVILTGLIAFSAGVAVGHNWPKIRRQLGPLLEKLGLQMADLGDFLSAATEGEGFTGFQMPTPKARRAKTPRAKAKVPRKAPVAEPIFTVHPTPKRRPSRKKAPSVAAPVATGTYGA